jgi:NAD(P)-dependent dehydrogenase (short-subunit alcohol dehydrogenase family)
VLLDVTLPETTDRLLATVGDQPLAGLVNNAGIAIVGPLELLPIDVWRKQFEVNVIGLVAVTQAFLPLLRRGRGRIVNIGSIVGRSALPGSGAYDSSKFAVEAITDELRMELHASGISVSVIEAGAVATPAWEKPLRDVDELSRQVAPNRYALYSRLMTQVREEATKSARNARPVDVVVKAVEHAMTSRRPKTRYLVGRDAWLWLLLNFLPDR